MNTNEPNNMSIKNLYFDIETGAAPDAEKFKPEFEAPGNIKDPVKIAAAIQDKENEWRDRLALSAITGQVLFCGFHDDGSRPHYGRIRYADLFKSDHDKAIEYAANDLELTRLCAKKILS